MPIDDTENDPIHSTSPDLEYAAVVNHYKNRGNNKWKNGLNGNSDLGTMSSHKSSDESVELLGTGDLYDSVLNGGSSYDRKSSTSSGRKSALSDRKSTSSGKRSRQESSDEGTFYKIADPYSESQTNGVSGNNKPSQGTLNGFGSSV